MIRLKTKNDLNFLRESGKILRELLNLIKEKAIENENLVSIDTFARNFILKHNSTPSFLGYKPEGSKMPYPSSICASVNNVVVHGIPNNYVLKMGDLLKIDIGVTYKGYITDAAITLGIGEVSNDAKKLIEATRISLNEGLNSCILGNKTGDIGFAIEKIAKKYKVSVVKGLTGHGVGFDLHEDPIVYNFGEKGTGIKLKQGLVLAIEPMMSLGNGFIKQKQDDSYVTSDGSLSAHFEHTVAITENGTEVLT